MTPYLLLTRPGPTEQLLNHGNGNFSSSDTFVGGATATHAATFADVDGGTPKLELLTGKPPPARY